MRLLLFFVLLTPQLSVSQPNCYVYPEKSTCRKACDYFYKAISFPQGSRTSQQYFDSAIAVCPTFAEAYREKAVPFLKTGQFQEWRKWIDQAVKLKPEGYLGIRGWCRFKFLKDYKGALEDLTTYQKLLNGWVGQSGDGNYDLRIIMALCVRELGNKTKALQVFDQCIRDNELQDLVGIYDYLHRGVTKFQMKMYPQAEADFLKQLKKYDQFADTYYYLGITQLAMKQYAKAKANLETARELLINKDSHLTDGYVEMPDQIYLSDIDNALEDLAKR